jgi:phage tail-like protein
MTEPFSTFRFEVVLDLDSPAAGLESPLCDAAFAECDGLEMTMEPKTVDAGGVNDRQVHLLGPVKYGQITLKRGMTNNLQLWAWFTQGTRPGSVLPAHGKITMWASDGTPALEFTLEGCLPVKMRAPSLNAREGLVAVEEISLVCEKFRVGLPGGSGFGLSAGASLTAGASIGLSAGGSIGAATSGSIGFSAGGSLSAGIGG